VVDTTPPVITRTVSPSANAAGWHKSPAAIDWTVTDIVGVASTHNCDDVTVAQETSGLVVTCTASDAAGNSSHESVTIKLDRTAPAITGSRSPLANGAGWNTGDVTVSFACNDGLSGVDACGPATQVVTAEGPNQSRMATATDKAGNVATFSVGGINIDKTAPVVSCSTTTPTLWPANHKLVNIAAAVQVTGGLSGSAGFTLVSVTSNEPDNGLGSDDTANDIQGFVPGTADVTGQLRAERSGSGAGRVYTLTYRGQDAAGNQAMCTTTVSVPHDQGKGTTPQD
jgi:hypothetical protein